MEHKIKDKILRTVFFGNNPETMSEVINDSNVLAIFTKDLDEPNIQEIRKIAKGYNIPVYYPKTNRMEEDKDILKLLNDSRVDLIISSGWHLIMPAEIINIPKYGTINFHPSFLPSYRGQHVIQWQIINGEREGGLLFISCLKN